MNVPLKINKLSETVINRIAAGEVIQRPANALKELLENSIDAKSSNIQIVIKNGGLKLLQIQDNGTGILKEDLEIVCERFTTSKLRKFEDLHSISTYGFRGEALASISHVAHLTITTKTADSKCAFRASYEDGKLKGEIKPCAANQGTQISVEDVFYNVNTRRKALSNPSEEYNRIVDVVTKYAVHNSHIGFSLKKQRENMSDVRTLPNSDIQTNIKLLYGGSIAKELLECDTHDELLKFKLKAYFTNANYSSKKSTFIIFINHRLVDSANIRKTLEQMYAIYLPKQGHPFVYLDLELDPNNIDVNVHPTKHEVHFLHEDKIVERIKDVIDSKLLGCNSSRTFYMQSRLPTFTIEPIIGKIEMEVDAVASCSNVENKVYDRDKVRTDHKIQKLDKFLKNDLNSSIPVVENNSTDENAIKENLENEENFKIKNEREIHLTSVLQLRQEIKNRCMPQLKEIFHNSIYVGPVNGKRVIFQHEKKLYLCNFVDVCEELFYQIILENFGNFGVIKFSSKLSLKDLVLIRLEKFPDTDTPEEAASNIQELLTERADMLEDYFSIEIDPEGRLCSIPLLIDKFMPAIEEIPEFIYQLGTKVNWTTEQQCFETFGQVLAGFYSSKLVNLHKEENWENVIEHILFPSVKHNLLPPKSFTQNNVLLQIAYLPDLYKVFERC